MDLSSQCWEGRDREMPGSHWLVHLAKLALKKQIGQLLVGRDRQISGSLSGLIYIKTSKLAIGSHTVRLVSLKIITIINRQTDK